jgi:hypothetical protein
MTDSCNWTVHSYFQITLYTFNTTRFDPFAIILSGYTKKCWLQPVRNMKVLLCFRQSNKKTGRWLKNQIWNRKMWGLNVLEIKLRYKIALYGFDNKHVTEEDNE